MTYEKRACKDMIEDTRNDMWGMLVRKHRRMSSNDMWGMLVRKHRRMSSNDMWGLLVRKHWRMSSNDMMGTDLQLHEGKIHKMTWLGILGR